MDGWMIKLFGESGKGARVGGDSKSGGLGGCKGVVVVVVVIYMG